MEIYRFETARFAVICRAEPEDCPPGDSFEFADDIAFATSGEPAAWFCAIVDVRDKEDGLLLGRDVLGCCSYRSFEEFVTSHRDSDAANRNTLALKAQKRAVCHYFPDMIREALHNAREAIERVQL